MFPPQAALFGANSTATYTYEEPIRYNFYDGGPQRRLSQALGATPRAPVVIPAPRVVEPVARPAAVAQPARQTSSVPGADTWRHAALACYMSEEGAVQRGQVGVPHEQILCSYLVNVTGPAAPFRRGRTGSPLSAGSKYQMHVKHAGYDSAGAQSRPCNSIYIRCCRTHHLPRR